MSRYDAVRKVLMDEGYDAIVALNSRTSEIDIILFDHEKIAVFKVDKFKAPPLPKLGKAGNVVLSKFQEDALRYAMQVGKVDDASLSREFGTKAPLMAKVNEKLVKDIQSGDLPMIIRRQFYSADSDSFKDCYTNGVMKNQFVTKTSSGSNSAYKGGGRDRWEKTIFGEAYQKDPRYIAMRGTDFANDLGMERPIYGYVDPGTSRDGASGYGHVKLILKPEVQGRVTFTLGNSSGAYGNSRDTGFFGKDCMAFLKDIAANQRTSTLEDYVAGRIKATDLQITSHGYTELQFHGGIDFRRDVREIVVEGSKRNWEHMQRFADRYNIRIRYTSS
jgi:hypothetical protein